MHITAWRCRSSRPAPQPPRHWNPHSQGMVRRSSMPAPAGVERRFVVQAKLFGVGPERDPASAKADEATRSLTTVPLFQSPPSSAGTRTGAIWANRKVGTPPDNTGGLRRLPRCNAEEAPGAPHRVHLPLIPFDVCRPHATHQVVQARRPRDARNDLQHELLRPSATLVVQRLKTSRSHGLRWWCRCRGIRIGRRSVSHKGRLKSKILGHTETAGSPGQVEALVLSERPFGRRFALLQSGCPAQRNPRSSVLPSCSYLVSVKYWRMREPPSVVLARSTTGRLPDECVPRYRVVNIHPTKNRRSLLESVVLA